MPNPEPLVSVIIPAYNSAHYLTEAVESVLGQTYPRTEVIVVDDGSTDHTAEVLERLVAQDPRVRVVCQANMGLPSARNSGIHASRGEFIAYLDADDIIRPEKIERQLAYLLEHPDIDLVYSDYQRADQDLEAAKKRFEV